MKLTLSKALRYKKRVIQKIATIDQRLSSCVTAEVSKEYKFDFSELMVERQVYTEHLVLLKRAIQEANLPILKKIYELSELKTRINLLKRLNLEPSNYGRMYGSNAVEVEYKTQLSEIDRDNMIETLCDEIESIQDDINHYNNTTEITVKDMV
jgi:hypothetical protein